MEKIPQRVNEAKSQIWKERALLSEALSMGVEPPVELVKDVLLAGRVTHVFGESGHGKSLFALGMVKEAIEKGESVVYLDMENGWRTTVSRLGDLGVDPSIVDERLFYFPSPSFMSRPSDRDAYVAYLDEVRPSLVVFDSWINFLAARGMDENASADIARWAIDYTHPARERGIGVLILDHVPHDARRSRGSTRKRDEVDVQWQLRKTQEFNRSSVGEIVLLNEKDRESWLPPSVKFSIGGSAEGFVFRRSEGTLEVRSYGGLTATQHRILDVLRSRFGRNGARFGEWHEAAECSHTTLTTAIAVLRSRSLVLKREDRYYPVVVEVEEGAA